MLESSRAFHVGYIYANLLGNEAGRVIYDGGALMPPKANSWRPGRASLPWHVSSAIVDLQASRATPPARSAISPSWALAIRG